MIEKSKKNEKIDDETMANQLPTPASPLEENIKRINSLSVASYHYSMLMTKWLLAEFGAAINSTKNYLNRWRKFFGPEILGRGGFARLGAITKSVTIENLKLKRNQHEHTRTQQEHRFLVQLLHNLRRKLYFNRRWGPMTQHQTCWCRTHHLLSYCHSSPSTCSSCDTREWGSCGLRRRRWNWRGNFEIDPRRRITKKMIHDERW